MSRLVNKIAETTTVYTDRYWYYSFECPSNYSDMLSFELLYQDYWMTVSPEDYIVDISWNSDGSNCAICMDKDEYEWILGDAFMRGWYNIHDHDYARMGFAPYVGSHKPAATHNGGVYPTEPVPDYYETDAYWVILGFNAYAFLAFAFAAAAGATYAVLSCMGILMASNPKEKLLSFGKKVSYIKSHATKAQPKSAEASSDASISLIYLK